MTLAERDLTPEDSGRGSGRGAGRVARLFPWAGVVAPWLVSRVLTMVVLLAAVDDPARGSRFVRLAPFSASGIPSSP